MTNQPSQQGFASPVPPPLNTSAWTIRGRAVLCAAAAAAALACVPLQAQQPAPRVQEAVVALGRALQEKSFEVLEPHLDDEYHAGSLTGERARRAMAQYVESGMRVPTAVRVDSTWTDGQGRTRVSTRFVYEAQETAVELVLSAAGRFVEVPLFRVQPIPGMTVSAGTGAAEASAKNPGLQQELLRMGALDQQHRASRPVGHARPDSATLRRLREADRANLRRLEEIIAQHGWPGVSLVGEEGSRAAFLVLQHADLAAQQRYLPLVRQAAAAREIAPGLVAMLEDRVLMQTGQEQIYGTQVRVDPAGRATLWPVRDEADVDRRRASVGLNPLAEYLAAFGIEYRPPTPANP
jgi:hypothetical protein